MPDNGEKWELLTRLPRQTMPTIFKKEITLNYIYYASGLIIPGVLSFAIIPLIIRLYSAEVYAQYSIYYNSLSIVSLFFYGWVGHSYIRFFSKGEKKTDAEARYFIIRSLAAGLVVFTAIIFSITNVSFNEYLILAPAFVLSGYYFFMLQVTQAKQKAKIYTISEIVRSSVNIGVPVIISLVAKDTFPPLLVLVSALFLSFCIPVLIFFKGFIGTKEKMAVSGESAKTFMRYGIPVAFFLSLSLALSVNDRFFIAHIMNYKASGEYAAVYDLINKGVMFLLVPVSMAFHPHIIKQYNEKNISGAVASIKKAILLELLIFVCGFIGLYYIGNDVLSFVLKQTITLQTSRLSYIIFIAVVILHLAMLVHKPLELKMQTKYLATGMLLAFLLNCTANYFLLTKYKDVMIAGYTTLGGSLFYILYAAYFSLKKNV